MSCGSLEHHLGTPQPWKEEKGLKEEQGGEGRRSREGKGRGEKGGKERAREGEEEIRLNFTVIC